MDAWHALSLLQFCGVAAALLFATIIAAAIYNILFSPLKKFPGPTLAAASAIPYWYNCIIGNVAAWSAALHDKYGTVVRIAPDRLSYINPDAWKAIYGHRTAGHKVNPKDSRAIRKEGGVYAFSSQPDDKRHAEVRKIFSNAFSDRALKLQEGLIVKNVDKLIGSIDRAINQDSGAQLDIVKLYNCTTFDIMGELTFGETLGLLDKSEYTPWVAAVFQNAKLIELSRLSLEYPLLGKVFQALTPSSITKAAEEHKRYSNDRVDRRLAKGTTYDQPDIWNLVIDKNNGLLSVAEMYADARIFMIAGTETTATLLSGLTYLLLTNPDKMRKVVDEVRAFPEHQLNLEMLPQLKYLAACFEEALRCYPPAPNGFWREVPDGGNVICGEWVPPRTRLSVIQLAAFRSTSNFKNPNSFIPERWLPGTGYDRDNKEVLQPFSYGPRNCIGKNLAYHEMRIIFSKVVWNFDLSLCPESDTWTDQKAWMFWDKPPLWIKAKRVVRA